jgi:PPOX class probable F420-dependent enzyme
MRSMTPEETRAFLLASTRTAAVATVRADGRPHVVPIWFLLDGDEIVFTAGDDTIKAANIRRDGRVSLMVDEETPPYAFVTIEGVATLHDDRAAVRRWAEEIGGRYMGADRAAEFGERNGVPSEMLVRVRPTRIIARAGITD